MHIRKGSASLTCAHCSLAYTDDGAAMGCRGVASMAESRSTLSSGPWPAILAGCLCRGSPCCQLPALLKLQWHAALGQEAVLQRLLCCEALLCKYTCPV